MAGRLGAHAAVERLRCVPRQLVEALVVREANDPFDEPVRQVPADRAGGHATGVAHRNADRTLCCWYDRLEPLLLLGEPRTGLELCSMFISQCMLTERCRNRLAEEC